MITLIDRESVFRVKPEFMNEKVKRVSERRTITDRSYAKGWNACLKMWHEEIEKIPLVERKKGMWLPLIETNEFGETYQAGVFCSRCGHETDHAQNYCPECGGDMKGDTHE